MAHFSKLGVGNIVEKVEVVNNDVATTEQAGIDFLNTLYKTTDVWKQTSYNTNGGVHLLGGTPFRKNYGGIGCIYDEDRDAFYNPQPYSSWILNEETCQWECPVVRPSFNSDTQFISWNEENQTWDILDK